MKTTFMYYSKSADAKPGEGAREYITPEDKAAKKYAELAAIPNWRKILSNFYQRTPATTTLFTLDERKWSSVEHYFQGTKFKTINKSYYETFALDSGSKLSRSVGEAAKKAGGKKGHPLNDAQRAKWEKEKYAVMEKAHIAKYGQNEDLRKLLLLTKDAVLTHKPGRSATIITEYGLMKVREKLASENEKTKNEEKESTNNINETRTTTTTSTQEKEKHEGKEENGKEEETKGKEKEGKEKEGKEKEGKEKEGKEKEGKEKEGKEKEGKGKKKEIETKGKRKEVESESAEKEKETKKRKVESSPSSDKRVKQNKV